jgi:hypothetical protein
MTMEESVPAETKVPDIRISISTVECDFRNGVGLRHT